jgi:hypothetical protein
MRECSRKWHYIPTKTQIFSWNTTWHDSLNCNYHDDGRGSKGKKKEISLNLVPVIILDFAGQEVFYSTHILKYVQSNMY